MATVLAPDPVAPAVGIDQPDIVQAFVFRWVEQADLAHTATEIVDLFEPLALHPVTHVGDHPLQMLRPMLQQRVTQVNHVNAGEQQLDGVIAGVQGSENHL